MTFKVTLCHFNNSMNALNGLNCADCLSQDCVEIMSVPALKQLSGLEQLYGGK